MTEALAEYCAKTKTIDESTKAEVRQHLLDWIGLVAGGRRHATSSDSVIAGVRALTDREVPAGIPIGNSLAPDRAGLLAGTFAHSLDFDDTHLRSSLHPGAPVIAAILPIARREEVDATTVLSAISLGYDVTCGLGRAIDPDAHYARGFHLTATCGSFGAAAAVGSLFAFDTEQYEMMFGVIGSEAAGSLQFLENGAWNKRLHPGLAAARGIQAAMLVRAGFRGAAKPITGEFGFLEAYSDQPHPEVLEAIVPGEAIKETGIKPYPCCRYMHSAIEALIELSSIITPNTVDAITVDLPRPGVRLTGDPIGRKRRPSNFVDCQFSLPFATALALIEGEAGLAAFLDAQDRLDDPELQRIMDTVEVVSTDRTNADFPERWSAHVRVEADEQHERFVTHPPGEPETPLDDAVLEAKFDELVEGTPLADRVPTVIESTRGLGEDTDLETFVRTIE